MLDALLGALRSSSVAELVSLAAGIAYALLAVRQNRWCWAFGALSSAILVALSWEARLPMQSALQVVYVAMAVYGFWHWSHEAPGGEDAGDGGESAQGLRIRRWPPSRHALALAAIVLLSLLLAPQLAAATAAAWPVLDMAATVGSLLATWMVARLQLENWLYWIAVDALSIFLYAAQGLSLIALLYAVYLVIAVYGHFAWRRRWRAQQRARGAP